MVGKMNKILIVDDEKNIRDLIKKYAIYEQYETDEASNGMEAIEKVKNNDYSLIIMDVMMPELDGFSAIKEIRKITDTPALILSARGEEYDKIHGFDLGIDDYIVKPFSPKELMMRVAAILSRYRSSKNTNQRVESEHDCWVYKGLKIDATARIVYVDDQRINLTLKEYDVLLLLTSFANRAVKREEILSKVWGYDFLGDDRTLDTHIKLLRKKIGEYGKLIVTIRGVGYRFEKE